MASVELSVPDLLVPETQEAEVNRATTAVQTLLGKGTDAALYTSRVFFAGASAEDSLRVAGTVAAGLAAVVAGLETRPRYLIAKGGITASDLATRSLGVKRAQVLGQLLPGVPVYRLGQTSRWPALSYIVFPGNVGGPETLTEAVGILSG